MDLNLSKHVSPVLFNRFVMIRNAGLIDMIDSASLDLEYIFKNIDIFDFNLAFFLLISKHVEQY